MILTSSVSQCSKYSGYVLGAYGLKIACGQIVKILTVNLTQRGSLYLIVNHILADGFENHLTLYNIDFLSVCVAITRDIKNRNSSLNSPAIL